MSATTTKAPPLERLMSPDEIAQALGLHRVVILRKIAAGEFEPVYRLSRCKLRVPESGVRRYLEARKL